MKGLKNKFVIDRRLFKKQPDCNVCPICKKVLALSPIAAKVHARYHVTHKHIAADRQRELEAAIIKHEEFTV